MHSAILLVLIGATVITSLWVVVRIWQSTPGGAVLTFLFGIPGWYFLFKYWNDEEKDIRAPFFINLAVVIILIVAILNNVEVSTDQDNDTVTAEVTRTKSNPEMERWCREKHDAVYDHALGTCVEPEPGQQFAGNHAAQDVMDQLGKHYSENGMTVSLSKVDDSTPGARNLSSMPGIHRMMQFEIKGKSAMPTIVMVGECVSADDCRRIESGLNQPDAPFAVARNGNLVFLGFQMSGDTGKIQLAKEVFKNFKVKT